MESALRRLPRPTFRTALGLGVAGSFAARKLAKQAAGDTIAGADAEHSCRALAPLRQPSAPPAFIPPLLRHQVAHITEGAPSLTQLPRDATASARRNGHLARGGHGVLVVLWAPIDGGNAAAGCRRTVRHPPQSEAKISESPKRPPRRLSVPLVSAFTSIATALLARLLIVAAG